MSSIAQAVLQKPFHPPQTQFLRLLLCAHIRYNCTCTIHSDKSAPNSTFWIEVVLARLPNLVSVQRRRCVICQKLLRRHSPFRRRLDLRARAGDPAILLCVAAEAVALAAPATIPVAVCCFYFAPEGSARAGNALLNGDFPPKLSARVHHGSDVMFAD